MSPKLTSVTCSPRRISPATSSRVYVQTPPMVSAVTKMCMLQFLEWERCLFLNVTVAMCSKHRCVMAVSPFPGHIIRRCGEGLGIKRASGKREHRHGFAYPDSPRLQLFLPAANLRTVV